jgi:hypothetical protein
MASMVPRGRRRRLSAGRHEKGQCADALRRLQAIRSPSLSVDFDGGVSAVAERPDRCCHAARIIDEVRLREIVSRGLLWFTWVESLH